jgi:multidrug efflux pump
MSKFFIERPIFAWVLAVMVMLAGLLSLRSIPVEQYPNIAPPSVSISTTLPGASAETLENSVTQIIEQSLTGIDNMRYFTSSSDADGNVNITITFEPKTNPDIAQMQVQNKLQSAIPLLPPAVQQQGIVVNKANNNFLLVIGLYSESGNTPEEDLGDILLTDMKDQISRINGVGNINIFGNAHAMRIWLNPNKLASHNLTVSDVTNALHSQNIDVSAGQLGGLPAIKGQQLNATIVVQSKLASVEEFKNILLFVDEDGSSVFLKDVAEIEIGSQNYSTLARYKGKPAAGMVVILASGANAIKTSQAIKETVKNMEYTLPSDVKVVYPYDSTPFIRLSIKSVIKTLIEAIILVFIVIYLFLQNFRATLVPVIAIPVVILGTFAVLFAFGYSVNTLTMFGLVLSIGLLVDDAIVVVENVERIMHEEGLSPKEATKKSMEQITGALIGIALVLSAVFVPMAFFSGSAGAIYRQFSITIVSSMVLSVFVALILSPSLCATILKPNDQPHNKFALWFNSIVSRSMSFYFNSSHYVIKKTFRFVAIYITMIAIIAFLFIRIPTSFLPTEDQGTMYLMVNSPEGATLERTLKTLTQVEDYFLNEEAKNVEHLFTVAGFSFAGRAQNAGFGFIGLKDWSQRQGFENSVMAIAGRAMGALSGIKDAFVFTFFPPPIRELGNASGFDLQLLDISGVGHETLMSARNQLLGMASQNPKLMGVRPNGLNDTYQFKIDINYRKAMSLGMAVNEITQTMQTVLGSSYINDYLENGRIKRVFLQGMAEHRMKPSDIGKWYVRNSKGEMVALSSLISSKWIYGSPKLERFNGVSSVNIQGSASSGISSGEAMHEVENVVSKLPKGIGYAWAGMSYEESTSQSQTMLLYGISLLVVFLSLAALYESWSVPFAVILTVPFGILGTIAFCTIFYLNNDIYFQVSLLTIIGLSARNAILIIEFAKSSNEKGVDIITASLDAMKMRFRPLMMTSMTFLPGVLPLAFASGAGSASQKAIGISIIGGIIFSTFVATAFVPMFYVLIHKLFTKKV